MGEGLRLPTSYLEKMASVVGNSMNDALFPTTGRLALLGYPPSRFRSIPRRLPVHTGCTPRYMIEGGRDSNPRICPFLTPKGVRLAITFDLGQSRFGGRLPASVPEIENQLSASFADQIDLLGYRVSNHNLAPSESLDLTLFWSPRGRPSDDYTVFAHLQDSQGQIRGQADSPPRAGRYPTSVWDAGEVIVDLHTLALGPDLPAGEYHLAIGLYDPENGQRVEVVDEAGQIVGDRVIISGLAVRGEERP